MDESAPANCLSVAPEHEPLAAESSGWVQGMNAEEIGLSLVELGGARRRSDDELDLGVGLEVLVRVGDKVDQGQPLVRIFARDEAAAAACRQRLKGAMPVSEEKCAPVPLIFERVG
jgi:thymidine phosphorylase